MKRDHDNARFRFMERVSEKKYVHIYIMYKILPPFYVLYDYIVDMQKYLG